MSSNLTTFSMHFITVDAASQELNMSPQAVRALLRKGYLQGYKTINDVGVSVWCVHCSLKRKVAKAGRPPLLKRRATASRGGK